MSLNHALPFSEPPYLSGLPSPYYQEKHLKFQHFAREFINKNLIPHALEWETAETVPENVFQEFADARMLIGNLPAPLPVEWLKRLGIHEMPGGIKVEDWDYLHFCIYTDEMYRTGLCGPQASMTAGWAFGIPPIIKYGSEALKEKFLPDLLTAKKRICLAVTEATGGSDIANIKTTAKKTSDGKSYIVNGAKKWITNGSWADYASMAVRTGGPGAAGMSFLVVPLKDTPGVETGRLKLGGQITGGISYINLENVVVPVENLIGLEGMGMRYITQSFTHERLSISVGSTRQGRVALSSALEYVMKRESHGKPLVDQAVVRHRLAKAGALLESQWSWVEHTCYQMSRLKQETAEKELGGYIALLKANTGVVFNECAQTALLLFGASGYAREGHGELIEKIWREVPGIRLPAGSEDVMLDLGMRQLVKNFKVATKELEVKL